MREKTVFEKHKFHNGRMVGWSKSGYRRMFPAHDVIFNAHIFIPIGEGFHGDLDLFVTNNNQPNFLYKNKVYYNHGWT